ncbi:3410_t:CDS:2 [Cetraspora pellucida]|uniref:3410_t:CDS:1 n=1 Tax=Cetraspora pellucida TaxID=1433469 RepID=A0ACA9K9Y3_9GLOM|nr:3410_t:CDS:2 [Cetraspora pellucida]
MGYQGIEASIKNIEANENDMNAYIMLVENFFQHILNNIKNNEKIKVHSALVQRRKLYAKKKNIDLAEMKVHKRNQQPKGI